MTRLRSTATLAREWTARPLVADDVLEFHAARLLLLLRHCGVRNGIDGLTKMAKLDFFVRYPDFFDRIAPRPPDDAGAGLAQVAEESLMVRHHYGPWDHRYYQVLGYLEGRRLVTVDASGSAYGLRLTEGGLAAAKRLSQAVPFTALIQHMKRVKKALGGKSGSALKRLIYAEFDKEVASRRLGSTIS